MTIKRVKEIQVAVYVAASGITSSTLSHYAEFWVIGYFFAVMAGVLAAMVFIDE